MATVRAVQLRLEEAQRALLSQRQNVVALRRQLAAADCEAQATAEYYSGVQGDDIDRLSDTQRLTAAESLLQDFESLSVDEGISRVIEKLDAIRRMRSGSVAHGAAERARGWNAPTGAPRGGKVTTMNNKSADIWRIVVFHGAEQVVFRAAPEYTFADLMADACHYWSVNPSNACLKDAFNRVWPARLNVVQGLVDARREGALSRDLGSDRNMASTDEADLVGMQGAVSADDRSGGVYVAGGFALSSNRGLRDQLPMIQLVETGRAASATDRETAIRLGDLSDGAIAGRVGSSSRSALAEGAQRDGVSGLVGPHDVHFTRDLNRNRGDAQGRVVRNIESVSADGLPSLYGLSYRNSDLFHDPEFQARDYEAYFAIEPISDEPHGALSADKRSSKGSGQDFLDVENSAGAFGANPRDGRPVKSRAGFETATFVNGANLVTCTGHLLIVVVIFFCAVVRFRAREFASVRYTLESTLAREGLGEVLSSSDAEHFLRHSLGPALQFDTNTMRHSASLFGPMQVYVSYSSPDPGTSSNCQCGQDGTCDQTVLSAIQDSGGGFTRLDVVSPSLLWVQACGSALELACSENVLTCASATANTGPLAQDVADVSESNLLRSYAYVFGPSASNFAWLSAVGFENVTAAAVEVAGYSFGSSSQDMVLTVATDPVSNLGSVLQNVPVNLPEWRALALRFNVYWRGLNLFSEVNLLLEQDFSGGVSAGLHVGDFQFDVFGYALPVFGATSQFLNAGTVASSTMSTSDVVLMCCDIYTILYMVFVVAALALKSQAHGMHRIFRTVWNVLDLLAILFLALYFVLMSALFAVGRTLTPAAPEFDLEITTTTTTTALTTTNNVTTAAAAVTGFVNFTVVVGVNETNVTTPFANNSGLVNTTQAANFTIVPTVPTTTTTATTIPSFASIGEWVDYGALGGLHTAAYVFLVLSGAVLCINTLKFLQGNPVISRIWAVVSDVAWHLCAVFAYFIMHVVAYSLMWYLAFGSASAEHSAGAQSTFASAVLAVLTAFLQGVRTLDLQELRDSADPVFSVFFVVMFFIHTAAYTIYLIGRFTFSFLQVRPK
eukprot:INCI6744.3.p1 GENE.INCI6744.3~~INCI6744.3.p1  ORF type:complete len:1068 (-),score=182.57 INCI6744.3:987-4190(-)